MFPLVERGLPDFFKTDKVSGKIKARIPREAGYKTETVLVEPEIEGVSIFQGG